jgi:23S rRNA (adenine2030-N6)-methyltransferase
MNYRHAYHAGNFADVLKHAVLALVIEHLKLKPAPFRIIDTHAGVGAYDLAGEQATKTGEWREGIGRVLDGNAKLSPEAAAALAPYLDVVRALNGEGPIRRYPGSPLLARRLMREGDRLVVNELHPEDHAALAKLFARDAQVKVLALDGFTALKSLLPPKERRGVVLVDPAYEVPGEIERLVGGLKDVERRFATGAILLWYPVKDEKPIAAFRKEIAGLGLAKALAVELLIRKPDDPTRLNGAGLIVINAPFTLKARLEAILPELAQLLGQGPGATFRLEELGFEPAASERGSRPKRRSEPA